MTATQRIARDRNYLRMLSTKDLIDRAWGDPFATELELTLTERLETREGHGEGLVDDLSATVKDLQDEVDSLTSSVESLQAELDDAEVYIQALEGRL